MDVQALDKKTMIHVAAELVIVSGVTFWLNSKINGQADTLKQLQKENSELKERLERIEQFLAQATGGPPAPRPSRTKRHAHVPDPGTESEEEIIAASSDDEEIEI